MRSIFAAALLIAAAPAFAEGNKISCIPINEAQKSASEHSGKWIELVPAQWEFLRGIYAINPRTPPGLPVGNKAVLVRFTAEAGVILFIDGKRACTPMDAPKALLDLLDAVAKDTIPHEGNDL